MIPAIVRFENFYTPEPNSGCWLWLGQISTSGYGRFCVSSQERMYAHHFSYREFVGALQKGMEVCHTCDLKPCVNPQHLVLGTRRDNSDDALKRGLYHSCENHRLSKLTASEVRQIRVMHGLHREIAAKFDISQATVSGIKAGKIWRNLP